MAFPTAVNSQITDSVTQANVKVLGEAPAVAMGHLYQAAAQALSHAAHNATSAQSQAYATAQAATTMGVSSLYTLDTASTGKAAQQILSVSLLMGSGVTDEHIKNLANDPDVIALHLGGFKLSDGGVDALASMKQLQYLHLGDTGITSSQLERLTSALPKAEIQHLSQC